MNAAIFPSATPKHPLRQRICQSLFATLLLLPAWAGAANFTVSNTLDSGAGSLRQALIQAFGNAGADTVTFAVTGTITLTSEIGIADDVTVLGPGADALSISGNFASRIFRLDSGRLALSGLTIRDGYASGSGGGIKQNSGVLVLDRVVMTNNVATVDAGAIDTGGATALISNSQLSGNSTAIFNGGAIHGGGSVLISSSTLSHNHAALRGGAIHHDSGTLSLVNCTVSGNGADDHGGGIAVEGANAQLSLLNVTITGNTANEDTLGAQHGGGVHHDANGQSTITVQNTIIAGNHANESSAQDVFGAFDSYGYNIIGTTDSSTGWGEGDLTEIGDSILFGPLADNGGPTPTHALLPGSLAMDAGNDFAAPPDDQRGIPRPQGCYADIGAFEVFVPFVELLVTNTDDSGPGSLRDALDAAINCPDFNVIRLNVAGTITLFDPLPNIYDNVEIIGPGPENLTVERFTGEEAPEFRIFNFDTGYAVLSGITIAKGASTIGAGVYNGGTLVLSNCVVTDNTGLGNGCGAGIYNRGNLTLVDCAVTDNTGEGSAFYGGGIDSTGGGGGEGEFDPFEGSRLTILNSVISGNHSGDIGGGLRIGNSDVFISGSTIVSNSTGFNGGGIFANNGGFGAGFGPAEEPRLRILDSVISLNEAGRNGGALHIGGGDVALYGSTIANNLAGRDGGGLFVTFGSVTTTNSTISGNVSGGYGGGLYIEGGSAGLVSTTIARNTAATDGGGIYNEGAFLLELWNAIVAGNTNPGSPDIGENFLSLGHNLIGDSLGSRGATNGVNGDLVGTSGTPIDPLLGPLQDNGGPTPTHALLPGSPAINAGDNANAPAYDQRGRPRLPGVVDIGAFEVQAHGALAFAASSYAVSESGTNVTITVERTGGSVGLTTVEFATDIGTAIPGVDYLPSNGTLIFADGETSRTFDVAVLDNGLADGDRNLTLSLSNPTGGATLGVPTITILTIVDDEAAPVITCPDDITVDNDPGFCSAPVFFSATATGFPDPAVVCEPPAGSTFPVGTNGVTCIASNAAGTATCSFIVTVKDVDPPYVYCPPSIVVTPDEGGTTRSNVTFTMFAFDNCSEPEVFCTPPSGSTFPAGTTFVTCVATDPAGNIGSCEFPVRVTGPGGPQIGGQLYATGGDILVEVLPATAGYTSELWLFSPAPARYIALNHDVGTIVNLGSFPAGTELIFRIYVREEESSFYTGPGSRNPDGLPHAAVESEGPGLAIVGFEDLYGGGDLDYDDNVFRFTGGIAPLGCISDITTSAAPDSCGAVVEYSVNPPDGATVVCTPPSGAEFPNGRTTVTCAASYLDGRTRTCSFFVTVVDGEAPAINCQPSLVFNSDAGQSTRANVTYSVTVSDNCPEPVVHCVPPSGSTFPAGVSTVTCVATDSSDNTNACTFTVRVVPQTLTVSSTADSGPGTLRQALLDANTASGVNFIVFQIPGPAPHTIHLLSPLPGITDAVTINGADSNGVPAILLDGSDASGGGIGFPGGPVAAMPIGVDGLVISAGNSVVQGLALYGFAAGIRIEVNGNNRIEGNFIGTDAAQVIATGNTSHGIVVNSSGNNIGGAAPGAGNVIVHSGGDGVMLGFGAAGNRIVGNVIAHNAGNGVALDLYAGNRNAISGNSIFANGALGVDLGADGVTPNDAGDSDGGPNGRQNFPMLTDARSFDGVTTIEGTMSGASNRNFRVDIFLNDVPDASGHGEGQYFLGAIAVTTSAADSQSFSVSFPVDAASTQSVTAIATDPLNNSSEFSGSVIVRTAPVIIVQPVGVNTVPGTMVTFCVTALSSTPIQYQWRHNGVNIPGATGVCYTIPSVTLTDGGSYEVAVANDVGAVSSATAELLLTSVPPLAAGDNFVDRVPILGTNGSVAGVNDFATFEPGEPFHAGKPGGKSVWYTWTAPATGIATFRTTGSTFDTLLGVYTGTSVVGLTPVVSDEDRAGFFASVVTFNAIAGTAYHIAIDGFAGETGQFTFSWELEVTTQLLPVIDLQPASATVGPSSNHTFTVNASSVCKFGHKGCREKKHQDDEDDASPPSAGSGGKKVKQPTKPKVKSPSKPKKPKKGQLTYQWYFFDEPIPGATGNSYTVTNVAPGKVGDYTVEIRSGNRIVQSIVAVLQINLTDGTVQLVQAVDKLPDARRGEPIRLGTAPGPLRAAQTVGGVPVAAAIGGFSRGYTGSQVFNNSSASSVSLELPCGVVGGASMWLDFVSDEAGTLVLRSYGTNVATASSFQTLLAGYTASLSDPDDLTFQGCGNNALPTQLSFPVTAGQTYLVGFDSVGGVTGDMIVSYTLVPPGTLTPLGQTAGGFQLRVTTRAGQKFSIETSSNLVNWIPMPSAINTTGSLIYTDTSAPVGMRFYRLALLP